MNVKELRELLSNFSDDHEVFYKFRPAVGTIGQIYHAYESEYGFFGKALPCVLLDRDSDEEEE